jgi:hypothetical protein
MTQFFNRMNDVQLVIPFRSPFLNAKFSIIGEEFGTAKKTGMVSGAASEDGFMMGRAASPESGSNIPIIVN